MGVKCRMRRRRRAVQATLVVLVHAEVVEDHVHSSRCGLARVESLEEAQEGLMVACRQCEQPWGLRPLRPLISASEAPADESRMTCARAARRRSPLCDPAHMRGEAASSGVTSIHAS